jgi:hypothetical protein
MMIYVYNPSYAASIGSRTGVPGQPWTKSRRSYLKNNESKKGWECSSSGGVPG